MIFAFLILFIFFLGVCVTFQDKCDIISGKKTCPICKERSENKVYTASDVARYIISHESKCGRAVTNLRLQKLLYFIQLSFFAICGRPCFEDDMEAWDYGPVVSEVYHQYKVFGSTMISISEEIEADKFSKGDRALMDAMLDACADHTTRQLVNRSHHQSPWKNAYVPGMNNIISKDSIQEYSKEFT